jgi:alkylation response protein AidB-like acyl-CoA dehydrogenase
MDVRLSDEQRMLVAAAEDLASDIGIRQPGDLDHVDVDKAWSKLTQAGLLELALPAAAEDVQASTTDLALVTEQLARRMSPAPFLGSAGLASSLLVQAGCAAVDLAGLADGSLRLAVGLDPSLRHLARLPARECVAFDAGGAHGILVLGANNRLTVLDAREAAPAPSFDPVRQLLSISTDAPELQLPSLPREISEEGIGRWNATALALLCADLVGAMQGALELMTGYAKLRHQFGVPIGSMQAVQHICAAQAVSVEAARSYMWYATWAADNLPATGAVEAAAAAKAFCSEAGRQVGEACIQVHGGIGITWECQAHLFLKRILLDRSALGDETDQLQHIADARYGTPATAGASS